MIKKIFLTLAVSVSLFAISNVTELSAKSTSCEHYFEVVVINQTRYLYEYTCDGTLVGITELDD